MERYNELETAEQLEILDKRISICKVDHRTYDDRYVNNIRAKRRVYPQVPVSIGYFNIRELTFILEEVKRNFLKKTHLFSFRRKKFLVEVIPDDRQISDAPYSN